MAAGRTGNFDRDEAERLLKEMLTPLAPQQPRDSKEGQPAYDAWQADLEQWNQQIEQLIWHLIEAAGAEGRRLAR